MSTSQSDSPYNPTVRFNLDRSGNKNRETYIIAKFRYGVDTRKEKRVAKRLSYTTRRKIKPGDWDFRRQLPRSFFTKYKEYKITLDLIAEAIVEVYEEFGNDISTLDFKEILDERLGRNADSKNSIEPNKSFFGFLDKYSKERKESPKYKRGTWKVLNSCINHLKAYNEEVFKKEHERDLDFEDIDWSFRTSFENWMYNVKNHSINYAAKMIQVLTQFLREAKRRKLTDTSIHEEDTWHIKKVKTKKIRYTFEELEKLYEANLTENYRLNRIRDLFVAQSFCGLRFGDMNRMEPEHIIEYDGVEMIEIRTQKNGNRCGYSPVSAAESNITEVRFSIA